MARGSDSNDYEPLLQSEEAGYVRDQRRKRARLTFVLTVAGLVVVGLVVAIYFLCRYANDGGSSSSHQYRHAAVASDVSQCSTIGKDLLQAGGNAVDAAIGTLLCMGVTDAQSMGIGGGFFMTIYNRTTQTSVAIDARETAPANASEDMFKGNPEASATGPLSIAVPGEIRGYWLAHQQYGRLPWSQLFAPAIEMTSSGFKVPHSLASAFEDARETILNETSLRTAYVNPKTGDLYKTGETLVLPELSESLRKISEGGEAAFYNGSLTDDILQDLEEIGSIITREDLLYYAALLKQASVITLDDGMRVFSPPPPASGVLLSFMLNVLDGYNLTSSDLEGKENMVRTYHRMMETFKFAYAKRTDLADEDFVNVTGLVANLTSRAYADHIRSLITDNSTHNISYYGPTFYDRVTTSTAHLSIVDADGNAVSVTSTVNARFGSKRRGMRTGIVFNDEMDDFSSPNITNIFGIPPSPANFIKPGKRPLSSMCPSVLVNPNGDVRLVVGAAGGSRITTATAYVATRELWLGESVEQAVSALRLHHQLLPDHVDYEEGFDQKVLNGLEELGHKTQSSSPGGSIVQAISRHGDMLYAASDHRKGGQPDGY